MASLVKISLALLMLLCLAHMPMGYYSFVRIAAMLGFGYLAFKAFTDKQNGQALLFLCFLILFQPLMPVYFSRSVWNTIDVVAAVNLLLSLRHDSTLQNKG